jgi:D-glycero-D-manno-heptose 1,7-bisphosphate phosphatase
MMGRMTRPAVFLDRDGTLNVECGHITRPEQMRLLPGAAAALRSLRTAGFACVVVTNQSGIGRGMMTEADLRLIHDEMFRQLHCEGAALDGLYYCGAAPPEEHPERKPAPGMLLRAARELGIDLSRSWMIGDSARDLLAGRAAGCRGAVLVRSGHDVAEALALLRAGDHVADDIAEAAQFILTRHGAAPRDTAPAP